MRIQTDGTITLEARECRVLTEAAAIMIHVGRLYAGEPAASINKAAVTTLGLVTDHQKPTPEPPDTSKGARQKGATDAD